MIVASFVFSIVFTSAESLSAFFSPFTRAWELALGALIAVCGDTCDACPPPWRHALSWLGLGAIVVASRRA